MPVPDDLERLNADDEAQRAAALFVDAALAEHRRTMARTPQLVAGTCGNCGERCLPEALYCDRACRDDHEAREAAKRRVSRTEPWRA